MRVKKRLLVILGMLVLFLQVFVLSVAASANDRESKSGNEPDYIEGRPLTEEEIKKQKECEPKKLTTIETTEDQKAVAERYKQVGQDNRYSNTSYESSYDGRKQNIVTPVRNQGEAAWCWGYSLLACAETSMIKNGVRVNGVKSTPQNTDLSEGALAYFLYHRECVSDPLHGSDGDKNNYLNSLYSTMDYAGNPVIAANFLTTWMGAKDESYYPIDTSVYGLLDPPDIKKAYTDNQAVIENIYYLNGNVNNIKEAVKEYGAVAANCYFNSNYMDYDTAAYSIPVTYSINHTVTIVGWDDYYGWWNFNENSNVNYSGAWIVKNSWGSGWGDEGYFYISYEDLSLSPVCAIEMQSADNYDNNYFYDGSSGVGKLSVPTGSKVANVFTSQGNESLEAVSFMTDEPLVKYSIQVYTNIKNASDPLSGEKALANPVEGITPAFSGTCTIPLNDSIPLEKGQKYSVVIQVEGSFDNEVWLGIEMQDNYGWLSFSVTTPDKVSFYSYKLSGSWQDIGIEYSASVKIKAYTVDTKPKTYKVVFKNGNTVVSTQYVEKGNAAKAPSVSKTGYTFSKWDKAFNNIQSDLVVNAVWSANKYTIYFSGNGGSGSVSKMTCTYDKVTTLNGNAFKKNYYTFNGWNTKKDGTGKYYKNKEIVKNLTTKANGSVTLYAQWKPYIYKINYNANKGYNSMGAQSCYYGTKYILRANAFKRSGYTYLGWNTKKDGKGTWYKNKATVWNLSNKQNGSVTLYAQWAKNVSITYLKSTKSGKFTIKYGKTESSQTGYQIFYSTSSKFTSSTTKRLTVKGYKNTSKTISGLTKGKKYYVRVRTYKMVGNTIYYGNYSSTKTVKIKK